MGSRILSRRVYAWASAVTATGGAALYISHRSSEIRNLDTATSRPLKTAKDGSLIPPRFPNMKTRDEQIADLKQSGSTLRNLRLTQSNKELQSSDEDIYDLLVIGGGATGTGIALDAATRGLKVALVERDDFSSGTSSKSTKLVHGGVRYLEKAVWNLDYSQYQLVKEALRERKNFLYTAPHLSTWVPVLLPLQKWWQAPYFWAGTKFYDFLAGSEGGLESSYFLSRSKAIDAFPMLKKNNLVGALVYYDGQHNDSRMNVSLALTAAHYGATTVNHLEVTGLEKDENGQLYGARVRDLVPGRDGKAENGDEFLVRAKGIVNATGPFADAIQHMDEPTKKDMIAPSLGVHVVLPGHFCPQNMGLIDPSTSDGRVIFFLPWQGNTIAGTTDSPCRISRNPVPDEKDVSWILNEIRGYLSPEVMIKREDILAAWSGIRPLVRDPEAKNTESLVRSHLVSVSKSGLLTCAGGKWTTYRQMAEDTVDKAIEVFKLNPTRLSRVADIAGSYSFKNDATILDGACQTHRIRLIGAHGYSKTLFINLIQHFGIEAEVAKHLAQSYGDRAWEVAALASPSTNTTQFPLRGQKLAPLYPFIDGEVRYAVQQEYAETAVDVLARRTRLSFLDAQAALEALPKVIDIMGEELQWNKARKDLEWTETVYFLASMGLPESKMGITREEVLKGRQQKPLTTTVIPSEEISPIERQPLQPGVLGLPLAGSKGLALS